MRKDRHRQRQGQLSQKQIAASVELRKRRAQARLDLDLSLPAQLPLSAHAEEISALLVKHSVIIIAGETGSGKTTQIPKLCLQLGLGEGGIIGHTQPRRLAARTVSQRIAQEVGCELGRQVGYAIRFSDQVGDDTLVKVMTDGILLTEIRRDRFLDQYDVIIIDEAHERSLNIDFLLGYLKRLLVRRRDLKVIVTSATIDVDRFSKFFDNAPVVEVGGRTYPVQTNYMEASGDLVGDVGDALEAIECSKTNGSLQARDVLVFFSGEREIFEAAKTLRQRFSERFQILPLYARLSFAEQRKIFEPSSSKRRVILATNVAETSITVPNIGFVIDPGFARINRYSYRSKLQRLPIEPVSQASANQRQGRCGRVAPGVCFRLYDEVDFLSRPEFTDPEIRRVNLASVVLQMQAFKLGDINTFPFLDPPEPAAVKDAMLLLSELQALSEAKLTAHGQAMARMPIDPRLARMLIEAHKQGAVSEITILVSALAVQDPRERPMNKRQLADQAHATFSDPRSDFITLLNLWSWIEEQRQTLTRSRMQRVLAKRFINPQRVREWREVHRQLRLICKELGYIDTPKVASYQAIHECILAGSLSLVATHDERGAYLGARGLKLRIFPGSSLSQTTAKWIVAGEIAETSRVYARNVAQVQPAWIEQHSKHLSKSAYSHPFWSEKRGEVMARMSLTLYGLRLVEDRQISFAQHDRFVCRDLFLREALVGGRLKNPPDFLTSNLLEIAAIQDMEAKGRRRDLLISDDDIYAFYAKKIPENVCRGVDLQRWLRKSNTQEVNSLFLSAENLLRVDDVPVRDAEFPSTLQAGELELTLKYKFAPGEVDDGVCVVVPIGLVPALSAQVLEWSVPGFLPKLVDQWLRSLPKLKRKTLAPLADKIDELVKALVHPNVYRRGRLLTALSSLLADRYNLRVEEQDWDRARVDQHLLILIRVVDEDGRTLIQGRGLSEVKEQLAGTQGSRVDIDLSPYRRNNLLVFPDGEVKEHLLVGTQSSPLMKFPGFVDCGGSVSLELFADPQSRDAAHRNGLARLAVLQLGSMGSYFRRELEKHAALSLRFATMGSAAELREELLINVIWYCFFENSEAVRSRIQFETRINQRKANLGGVFNLCVETLDSIFELRYQIIRDLDGLNSKAYAKAKADILTHLESLAPKNVLSRTAQRHLRLVPRYLRGLLRRVENLPGHVLRDQTLCGQVQPLLDRLDKLPAAELNDNNRWLDLRCLLEELRLKLFAETISKQKVSDHPLHDSYFGSSWKVSSKRVAAELLREEQRIGLA